MHLEMFYSMHIIVCCVCHIPSNYAYLRVPFLVHVPGNVLSLIISSSPFCFLMFCWACRTKHHNGILHFPGRESFHEQSTDQKAARLSRQEYLETVQSTPRWLRLKTRCPRLSDECLSVSNLAACCCSLLSTKTLKNQHQHRHSNRCRLVLNESALFFH